MPLDLASSSIAAPDALSRLTIMSTLTPSFSMLSAMVFIVVAVPCAFWMLQLRLFVLQAALRASGSAVTQRCEDLVSGRMMPTFAPLPSSAPPVLLLPLEDGLPLEDPPPAGGVVVVFFLLEAQALSTSEAATPATTKPIALLRMGCTAFRGTGDRVASPRRSRNVVRVNISVRTLASTPSKPFRYPAGTRLAQASGDLRRVRSETVQSSDRRTYCMMPPCR